MLALRVENYYTNKTVANFYNLIKEIPAGEPHKWYSHDPDNYRSTELLKHTVSADVDLPTEKGKYYIGFYLKNTRGEYARFANEMPFENGYNILSELEI